MLKGKKGVRGDTGDPGQKGLRGDPVSLLLLFVSLLIREIQMR